MSANPIGRSGEAHPNWKGGIKPDYYREKAFKRYGKVCQRCGSTDRILVHHKDDNRRNSDIENLEVLCKSCHNKHHHGNRVSWSCPACGTVLKLQPYWAARRKFCSNACRLGSRRADGRF